MTPHRLAAAILLGVSPAVAGPVHFAAPTRDVPVRDAPGGAVVGALPAGRGPVEAVRVQDGWALIGQGDGDVWAAVDALSPVSPPTLPGTAVPAGLVCAGTEPFWSLRISADAAELAAPGEEPVSAPVSAVRVADGHRGHPAAVRIDTLTAVVRPALCSDGMSDRTYPWAVDVVLIDGERTGLRSGCCRLPAE
jgi:uncharacterized membrane protein